MAQIDLTTILPGLLDVAEKVARTIVPGGGAAIDAGKAALALLDKVRETAALPAEQVAKLEETRAELEARVNAHADRTAASLE